MKFYIKRQSGTDIIESHNAISAFLKSLSDYEQKFPFSSNTFNIISIIDENNQNYSLEAFTTLLEVLLLKPE
jgi:hypothetical protein